MDFLDPGALPFVSAGLALMLVGGALASLRRLPRTLYELVERFFIVRMEILDEDEAYQWMQIWLADRLAGTLSVSVVTRRASLQEYGEPAEETNPESEPTVHFVPAVGTYFFWYRRRLVTLCRDRQENSLGSASLPATGGDEKLVTRNRESFHLRILSRDRGLARALIEDCRRRALPNDGRLNIRVANYNCWALRARIQPRPLSSVLLDGNQAERLLADMREFLESQQWYQRTGVPYRRGYLLHGPPGNGKTSVVKALAGELNMSIYLIVLSDPAMNDHRLNDLLGRVPDRNLVLLEDIDCAFVKRHRNGGREGGLTFAGVLNAIDGIASPEGRLILMTTNHPDRLDPALVRPGRADVKMSIGNATAEQAARLFARFFPSYPGLAEAFAARIEDRRYSMATLQAYLMTHRHDPEAALREMIELASAPAAAVSA